MRDVLVDTPATLATSIDLLRGALDARLHGDTPSRVPALAALSAGAVWIVIASFVALQPVPPDWPGYLIDIVPPALVAAALVAVAAVGTWLRIGDGADGPETLALDLVLVGQAALALALSAVLLQVDYVTSVGIATVAAALGSLLLGAVLLRAGDRLLGGLLIVAGIGPGPPPTRRSPRRPAGSCSEPHGRSSASSNGRRGSIDRKPWLHRESD